MRRTLVIGAIIVLASGVAMAASITGSKHDLSSTGVGHSDPTLKATNTDQVCGFCHTPHNASAVKPLWNHSVSTTVTGYTMYGTTTNGLTTDALTPSSDGVSALCMSCHDGTVGMGSLLNDLGGTVPDSSAVTFASIGGLDAELGSDLSNDHPVNMTWAAQVGNTVDPSTLGTGWVAPDGKVQCSSCHLVHDNAIAPFLRASNSGSSLCKTCHTN